MLSNKVSRRKHKNVAEVNNLIIFNNVTNSFNLNLSPINCRVKIKQVTTIFLN